MQAGYQRKPIFGGWLLPEVIPTQTKAISSVEQNFKTLKVEEAIKEAFMIYSNIEGYEKTQSEYRQSVNSVQHNMQATTKELFKLCSSKTNDASQELELKSCMFEELQFLHLSLKKSKEITHEIKNYFRSVCLVNYDSRKTQIEFINTPEQARAKIIVTLRNIKTKAEMLQESLAVSEQSARMNGFFGESDNFLQHYNDLMESISNDNLTDLHLLMLGRLKDFDEFIERTKEVDQRYQFEFSKYEAVYDSVCLMEEQTRQMKDAIQVMSEDYREDANGLTMLSSIRETGKTLNRNAQIYRSNSKLFVRYGTETTMNMYQQRRTEYINSLDTYQESLNTWEVNNKNLSFFLKKREDFIVEKDMVLINNSSNSQHKKNVVDIYFASLNYSVEDAKVQNVKQGLLRDIQTYCSTNDILLPSKEQVSVEGFENQVLIFHQLQLQPIHQKESFVRDKAKIIQAYKLESSLKVIKNSSAQSYEEALQSLLIMNQNNPPKLKLKEFGFLLQKNKWKNLPYGFISFLHNYICDLSSWESCEAKREQSSKVVSNFRNSITAQLSTKWTAGEFNKSITEQLLQQGNLLRQAVMINQDSLSEYTQELRTLNDNHSWNELVQAIKHSFAMSPKSEGLLAMAGKMRECFQFDWLCTIGAKSALKEVKIVNLLQLTKYAFGELDFNFLAYRNFDKISAILRLQLFRDYLSTLKEQPNYLLSVRAVLDKCKKLYYCDYLTSKFDSKSPVQPLFSRLMKLQRRLADRPLKWNEDPSRSELQVLTAATLKGLHKMPLTIATKVQHERLEKYLEFKENVDYLQGVLQKQRMTIEEISLIFKATDNMEAMRQTNERKFEPYENIILKEKRENALWLQKLQGTQGAILSSLGPELYMAKQIYINKDSNEEILSRLLKEICIKAKP